MEPIDPRVTEVLAEVSTSVTDKEDPNLTTLSSGVILRHKRVPPMVLAKLDEKYADPDAPHVWDSEKERSIPNPNDPEYIKALDKNRMQRGTAMIDVLIGLGTEIVHIPEGMQTPDDEEWVENLSFVSIEVPKLKIGKYLAWVKYYAAEDARDIQLLAKKGSAALGVSEEDVARSIENFQGIEARRTDTGSEI